MDGLIPAALREALEAGRSRYNAEFAMARHRMPGLDPVAFQAHLRSTVGPIADAVSRTAPERVRDVVDVLYEFSLDLVGKGLFDRYPPVLDGWRRLLVALAPCLAAEPRLFAGSVTNALHRLASTPSARAREWTEGMLTLGYGCPDVRTLLEAGKVLAWRAGMAHFRQSALGVCRGLEAQVALSALGIGEVEPGRLGGILQRLEADPWLTPENAIEPGPKRLRIAARVGAFRGFGGLFLRPPRVLSIGDDLFVTDGQSCWSLHADAFGAVFQRVAETPRAEPGNSRYTLLNGVVHAADGQREHFTQFLQITSLAGTNHTLAVTVPQSHSVYLVAAA